MNETTNPKDQLGRQKPPLQLVPASANIAEAGVFALGAAKYGPFNWREHSVSAQVYVGALLRHVSQWFDGEDVDSESGESHLAHARACLGILLDAKACGKLVDDRPLKGAASQEIKARVAAAKVQQFYDALPEGSKELVTDHNVAPTGPVTLSEHEDPTFGASRTDFSRLVLRAGVTEHIAAGESFHLCHNSGTGEPEIKHRLIPARKTLQSGWKRYSSTWSCVAQTNLYPGNVLVCGGWNDTGNVLTVRR